MVNISTEVKRKEAIRRMNLMHLDPAAVKDYSDGGIIKCAEDSKTTLRDLTESELSLLEVVEKEHDIMVYLAIKSFCLGCRMISFLFVSNYEENWELDDADLEGGYAMTYTVNLDAPELSEMGSIGFEIVDGIPRRLCSEPYFIVF